MDVGAHDRSESNRASSSSSSRPASRNLAIRSWRTTALSTVFVVLLLLVAVSVLSSFGLRSWIENNQWDRVALHLWPLALVYAALGVAGERTARAWLSTPLYIGAIAVLVASLDLLALDGRTMAYLDLSLHRFQSPHDTVSIDTLAALTMNGLAFYFVAVALERWGSGTAGQSVVIVFTRYSCCIATMGLMRNTRRAGTSVATSEITSSTPNVAR
jgi:hypothetical protein